MLRGLLCPDPRSWTGSGLAACLEAVRDQVFSISFGLVRVTDIMAEGSFKKKTQNKPSCKRCCWLFPLNP